MTRSTDPKEVKGVRMSSTDPKATPSPRSDAELVRMAQDGDSDAFAALFHAHRARIYSLCLRLTSNPAEAEDLTQDAFVQVFRKLATFRGDSALSTWLYRVAYNTVLMHFRKHAVRQMSLDEPADSGRGSAIRERGKVDEQLSGSIDRLALIRAMEKLPSGYRTVFLLHEVKGYEHHEIASLLRCSVGNSKSQLHKAKSRMRDLLGLKKSERVPAEISDNVIELKSEDIDSFATQILEQAA